ncbi:phosphatidylinositol synthase, putative [Cryptosporidium muris RN66]|uniref:Phosphatidylinositol synthase, putative n=1 Tax=Cryptosporidium muris (strain RN66) TaxID=441375 RepID=B6AAP2_CRYMR|nr:phosphatidylinositol synthase, putative [Cryptosporidium muris RN66]EEA05444.1 phosphatidylinositol synthase, putative [Cryptosporidium muris RN66]|eukprot:XP_002139793.1 phosphatidylinositol synthase [Cryptosporidium muris RN66]
MMTDRCCTLALILTCLTLRSSLYYLTVIYLIGDIAGHWLYMMASHMYGKASHKDNSKDMWFVLNMYYSNKIILFASHGCNELFWLLMYLQGCIISKVRRLIYKDILFNIHQNILWYTQIFTFFVLPLTIFKNITNYVQLLYGCKLLLEMDISEINKQFK